MATLRAFTNHFQNKIWNKKFNLTFLVSLDHKINKIKKGYCEYEMWHYKGKS